MARILRITTPDTYAQLTSAFYLQNAAVVASISALQNVQDGKFQWLPDDYVLISYGDGEGFFTVDNTANFTFIPTIGNREVMSVTSTAVPLAAFLANYATPVEIIPPSASLITIVDSWAFQWIYGSAQLAGGGAIGLQYGNTIHAGGIAASNTIAAADLTGITASSIEYSAGGVLQIEPWTNVVNTGIYLSNPTAAFTGGTGGSAVVTVWYRQIPEGFFVN